MNKTEKARSLLKSGKIKESLAILKSFRIGISKKDSSTLIRGYECIVHPDFYQQLGFNPSEETQKAVETARRVLA